MQLNQICRLCLEEKTNNETVLVEIFSALVNQPGKVKLNDKIQSLTGVSIMKNDGLPPKICHKCVVSIDSFYDFKNRVLTSDEKLRQFLNLNGSVQSDENHDDENEIDDETDVIRLDPDKVYESSEEEDEQMEISFETNKEIEPQQQENIDQSAPSLQNQEIKESGIKKSQNVANREKMEIFHCKYCDVVFSELELCANHENFNHDKMNPYECSLCPFKVNQHQQLIIHIKNEHQTDKPFFCIICSKNFMRRSDLRKHIFVHAGIRLFSCDLCSKSFTRAQNLAKHKRTHSEANQKNHKCTLCPKAYASSNELSRHMEIHMNRNTLNCKYCNQVFTQRDELEIHQQSHIAQMKAAQVQQLQSTPIVFYNQAPPETQSSPMNFYKEHVELPHFQQQQQQTSIEHPIINQLLTNFNNSLYKCDKCLEQFPTILLLQNHQAIHHSKNFSCAICNNSYYKKKELDRHVISAHTDIKYNCSKCSKSFSRKDKLIRHERTHLVPAFFNCSLCPAVFVRKHLLDLHSKIHLMPNNSYASIDGSGAMMMMTFDRTTTNPPLSSDQAQHNLPLLQELPVTCENFMSNNILPTKQPSPLDLSSIKMDNEQEYSQQINEFYPMNLTVSQSSSEPMNLSNEKTFENDVSVAKLAPPSIVLESDDDDLKIIENNNEHKMQEGDNEKLSNFIPKTENEESTIETNNLLENDSNFMGTVSEKVVKNSNEIREINEIANFQLTSSTRLSDLDKLEPSKDLPYEILQSPDI